MSDPINVLTFFDKKHVHGVRPASERPAEIFRETFQVKLVRIVELKWFEGFVDRKDNYPIRWSIKN